MRRIKSIKFYQGVLLSGSTLSSFQPDDMLSDATLRKGRKAEVAEHGVEINDTEMTVLVPWNNVAYIQFIDQDEPKKAIKK